MNAFRLAAALAALALASTVSARAELKVAAIFGDNMVLQQQMPVPIWGWSDPGSKVTVSFAGQTKSTRAGADGKWLVKLGKLKASAGSQSLTVESGTTITLTNILVGEVWLASGQSNMEKPIGKQQGQKPVFNAEQELASADNYPQIRIFLVDKNVSATPIDNLTKFKSWRECSSNNLNHISFSAAAFFFGRELCTNLNVPVGLVESSYGGTRIEPWTPPAGFESVDGLEKLAQPLPANGKIGSTEPMVLYNAMIAPIVGFAMRGALWYQGESNLMGTNEDNDYLTYMDKMKALVNGWRKLWDEGNFPFYYAQIAPFKYYSGKVRRANSADMLPEFWEEQTRAASHIKNSAMLVTLDIADNLEDIHPRDKQDVGHRFALLALNKTYGEKNLVCSGPTFHKLKISGNTATLTFDHTDGGLTSKDGKPLTWFTIAGADSKFVPADAKIVDDTVQVSAAGIDAPVAVRFAWAENAQPNFFNGAGLPAGPFRTDK